MYAPCQKHRLEGEDQRAQPPLPPSVGLSLGLRMADIITSREGSLELILSNHHAMEEDSEAWRYRRLMTRPQNTATTPRWRQDSPVLTPSQWSIFNLPVILQPPSMAVGLHRAPLTYSLLLVTQVSTDFPDG